MFIAFFLSIFLYFTTICHAQLDNIKDIIRDPVISRRCKALLRGRLDKIRVRQRLNTMLLRNEKLQGRLKASQEVVGNRLRLGQTQLKNNVRLTDIRLESMEENIVRKGCPGITL